MVADPIVPLVVVIEDEKPSRDALGRLLRAGGFEPALFDGAEAFLAARRRDDPLCLIVDVHLGGMSGLDLQQHLRSGGCPVPVIIITGTREPSISKRARQGGCAALLWKPFTAAALLGAIASLSPDPHL
jgi:FixJ family two-component response regulator